MNGLDSVTWFPLCAGLTILGLVLSWRARHRRGLAAGMRGAAWSLLPLAAYLTGVVTLVWRIGVAVTRWGAGFAFSPAVGLGVAVTGVSAALFAVSGLLGRRGRGEPAPARGAVDEPSRKPRGKSPLAAPGRASGSASGSDEFADIEELLRNRGIG